MKKVLKLIAEIFCVLLPLLFIWIYIWVRPLGFVDNEAPHYFWNKEVTNTTHDKYYKTIILGDSAANAAYMPDVLSESSINLALGGATPIENYYVLQEWLAHNKAPEECFISFMDYHFTLDEAFWTRTMYSHRFNIKESTSIIKDAIRYNDTAIITDNYIEDFIAYELRLPNKYVTSIMKTILKHRSYNDNVMEMCLDTIHGGRYIARGVSENTSSNVAEYGYFRVSPIFDDYYRRILDLCEENNISVHIVKLPLLDNTVYTDNYKNEFYNYYEQLKERYKGLTVDWIASYENEFFADEHHMNSHGALRFSNELKSMFPEIFNDNGWTLWQIEGINDYLLNENKVEQIIKWIDGKDYTVLINDPSGYFITFYRENLENMQMPLYTQEFDNMENPGIYYFSGINNKNIKFSLYKSDNGIMIQLNGKEAQLLDKPADTNINILVIDNYNNNIVCKKTFQYIENGLKYII